MLKDELVFEWSESKNLINRIKHGVSFEEAQFAFLDSNRIILKDVNHSDAEKRFYCLGVVNDKSDVLTARFTYRDVKIRIFGADFWRRGKRLYGKENNIY